MFTLNCKGRLLVVDKPIVMGIINTTDDSFYADSRFNSIDAIVHQAEKMLLEGATILDIGGQSTRPGSTQISIEEELKRVIKPIQAIRTKFPEAYISIDTFNADVAKEAVTAGASIVNDISAGSMDATMIDTVAGLQVPYVLMHMKGTPQTMVKEAQYTDVVKEVLDFFITFKANLEKAGIQDIIIDPGFGFAKNREQNFSLLKNLSSFSY